MAAFRYVGGDPALDFVNTVNWTVHGPDRDRLADFESLVVWAVGAGVMTARDARRLGASPPSLAARRRVLNAALDLRGTLQRLFTTQAQEGRLTAGRDLADLNRLLRKASAHQELVAARPNERPSARWDWREARTTPGMRVVWDVARSAAALLTSDEAPLIRRCPSDECGWVFVDRSRNRMRRWCEMETCGTRAKNRRRGAG